MQNRSAFTLIELLIVITIIGILAVAFLPQLLGAPSKSRDTVRIDHINTLYGLFAASDDPDNLLDGSTWRCADQLNLDKSDFGGELPRDPGGPRTPPR